MIAAKAFDPVMGVDIHIIQPPGPVPPVPIPHPFIGMLVDPMDFAPIIGATVMVNGMPRATAGTGGKCIPPHIPIGGVFVKPPASECEIFMGSSTVLADGDPLSFLGMPCLSCHDVGMPPPPRPKKKRKTKSLTLPTSVVLAVPAGGLVLVGGPPTVSMMALGMKAAMAGLGKAFKKLKKLQKASKKMKALSDKVQRAAKKAMDKLGVPPNVQNRVRRAICSVTGHPVDVATGKVFTEAVDFTLDGRFPFSFERVWYSSSVYSGPLGYGWHHVYDQAMIAEPGFVCLRSADGRPIVFPAIAEGESHFDPVEKLRITRNRTGFVIRDGEGDEFTFGPVGRSEELALVRIDSSSGERLLLDYDAFGRLGRIVDEEDRHIDLYYDAANRIAALTTLDPLDDSRRVTVASYRYDEAGNLVGVADAARAEFTYQYDGHLLVRETNRIGYSFHFRYDGIAPGARCVATAGDGRAFLRELSYDTASRQTTVRHGNGRRVVYHWTDAGVVEKVVDSAGGIRTLEWDDFSNLIATTEPDGGRAEQSYDAWGNPLTIVDSLGNTTAFEYDDAGHLISETDPMGATQIYVRDARGNVITYVDPMGAEWHASFDERGRLQQMREPVGRVVVQRYPGTHVVEVHDDLGFAARWEYDNWNRLVRETDRWGEVIAYVYDLTGNLVEETAASGTVQKYVRDAQGNLIAYQDASGAITRYEYTGNGRLAAIHSQVGGVERFSYDPDEERLAGVTNEQGEHLVLELNGNGSPVRAKLFDGRELHFEYDAAGRRTRMSSALGVVDYSYDTEGRLLAWRASDGTWAEYTYDGLGRLVEAQNEVGSIARSYDAAGRLLEEKQTHGVMACVYGTQGERLKRMCSTTGRTISYAYDQRLRLRSIGDAAGTALQQLDFSNRNELLARTFGVGAREAYDYDPVGNLLQQSLYTADGRLLTRRTFDYDDRGSLISRDTTGRERDEYEYRADRALVGVSREGSPPLAFPRDVSGRLLARPDVGGFTYAAGSAITRAGAREYYFDHGGRVGSIATPEGEESFSYDVIGRLLAYRDPSGAVHEYTYDALDRRVSKVSAGNTRRFMWDGFSLLSEHVNESSIEYAFVPGYQDPMLMWHDEQPYHFVVTPWGTPEEILDESGRIVWRGQIGAFGELETVSVEEISCELRMRGQYHDQESGLHYNITRYYDPVSATFISPDPIGYLAGLNTYAFGSDALNWHDPLGMMGRPNSTIRKKLKGGDFGDNCAACGRQTVGDGAVAKPQADHVHADKLIQQEEGFDELNAKDKRAVQNLEDNFQNTCNNCNASKGAKNVADWDGHPDRPMTPARKKRMRAHQRRARRRIRAEIRRRLKNPTC